LVGNILHAGYILKILISVVGMLLASLSLSLSLSLFTQIVAVPWLRRLVAGLSPRRPGFDPGSVHVGFVVDKVALGHVFPRVLRFSLVNFIPPMLHYLEKVKKKKN
jgi:hypothetical protein